MNLAKAFATGLAEEWRDYLRPVVPRGDVRFTLVIYPNAVSEDGLPLPAIGIVGLQNGRLAGKFLVLPPHLTISDDGQEVSAELGSLCGQIESELRQAARKIHLPAGSLAEPDAPRIQSSRLMPCEIPPEVAAILPRFN